MASLPLDEAGVVADVDRTIDTHDQAADVEADDGEPLLRVGLLRVRIQCTTCGARNVIMSYQPGTETSASVLNKTYFRKVSQLH